MKTPLRTPLRSNAPSFFPKDKLSDKNTSKINVGDIFNYLNVETAHPEMHFRSKHSGDKKVIICGIDNNNVYFNTINTNKSEGWSDDKYVDIELGEVYKSKYVISTHNYIVEDKQEFLDKIDKNFITHQGKANKQITDKIVNAKKTAENLLSESYYNNYQNSYIDYYYNNNPYAYINNQWNLNNNYNPYIGDQKFY